MHMHEKLRRKRRRSADCPTNHSRSLALSLVSVLHVDEGGSTESSVLLFEMTDYGSIDRRRHTLYNTTRTYLPTYLRTCTYYVHTVFFRATAYA